MAGATEVCRRVSYRDTRESSVPVSCRSTTRRPHTATARSFIAPSAGQYHLRASSSYPPAGSVFGEQCSVKTQEKPPMPQSPVLLSHALRFCPFGLRSQATVRAHLNRMLFNVCSSVAQCPFQETGAHHLNVEIENLRNCQLNCKVTEKVPPREEVPPKEDAPQKEELQSPPPALAPQVGGSCQLLVNGIHSIDEDQIDSDSDDEDSDSEDEEEEEGEGCEGGYESDSEEDDDFVQFSDDSDSPPCALLRPPKRYMSLFSEESGYGGEESGSPLTCEELSGGGSDTSESWGEESDDESSKGDDSEGEEDVLWEQFQLQALSPCVSSRKSQCAPLPLRCDGGHTNSPTQVTPSESSSPASSECVSNSLSLSLSPSTPHCPSTPTTASDPIFASGGSSSCKRVSFKPDCELTQVHHIITWNFAYRSARKGPWEQYARDRLHFKRRIEAAAPILESCLAKKLSACGVR